MKKYIKVSLWIVGIIFVIFIILVGVICFFEYFYGKDKKVSEAITFAKTTNKEGCFAETVVRLAKCDDSAYWKALRFGKICIKKAKGSKLEFCAGKPTDEIKYSKGPWAEYCKRHEISKFKCIMLFSHLKVYCRGN